MSVPVTARQSSDEPNSPFSEQSPELSPQANGSEDDVNPGTSSEFHFLNDGGVLSALANVVMNSVGANGLALAYEREGTVICRASCGTNAPPVGTRVNLSSGIAAQCLREGTTVICGDTETDERVNKEVCRSLGVRSMFAVPLRHGGRIIGLAQAFYSEANAFSTASISELESSSDLFISCLPEVSRGETVPAKAPETPLAAGQFEPALTASSSVSAWAEEIDRLLEQRGFKPASADLPHVAQEMDSSAAIFSQLRQTLWWKRVTTLAIGVVIVCLLLWAGLRAATGGFSSTSAASSGEVAAPGDTQRPISVADLSKQAQGGDREAQIALAQRYHSGTGVPRNLRKAYSWYIIAGEAGSDAAKQQSRSLTSHFTDPQIAAIRFEVGDMYVKGIGTPRPDKIAAYKWFMLSEAAGDKRAKAELQKLGASMRPAEVQEARTRASDWLSGRRSSPTPAKTASR